MKFCPKCGHKVEEEKRFCTNCGNKIVQADNEEKEIRNSIEDTIVDNTLNKAIIEEKSNINLKKDTSNTNIALDNKKSENIPNISMSNNNSINNSYNSSNNSDNRNVKSNNNSKQKIVIWTLIVTIVLLGAIVGVFFDTIRGNYYIMKSNDSYIVAEKLDYATKAINVLKNDKTKELIKQTLLEIAESDVDLAEKRLEEISSLLDQNNYKEIASGVKNKKLEKLYSEGKYEDALMLFQDIDKLGGDFKNSKNYEQIMLKEIADITGTTAENSKSLLMEKNKICFENFDDDPYDEILEVKDGQYYRSDIKINLYKYSEGKYKQVDTKLLNNNLYSSIQGIYDYDKDQKGLYLQYTNNEGDIGIGVMDVANSRVQLMGVVFGNNYTKPDDVDNDGIYEIVSNSISMFSSSSKGTSKWYKINSDGSAPTEVNGTEKGSNANTAAYKSDLSDLTKVDYIFPNSDSEYLSDNDLSGLTKEQLGIARNEIFARYGYVFTTVEYVDYFDKKSWYKPNSSFDGDIEKLNKYEKANVELIKKWEAK